MSEVNQKRLDEAMELVASAIGGTWNGNQLVADVPNREELDSLNQSIKQYLNGELDTLDGKLGKQIETVVNQAKDEFSVAIGSVEKKVDGIEVGGRNLILNSTKYHKHSNTSHYETINYNGKKWLLYGYARSFLFNVDLEKGQTYTISIPVYNPDELDNSVSRIMIGHLDNIIIKSVPPKETALISQTFTSEENESQAIVRILVNGNDYPKLAWGYPKLEKGTIATDWTPAPEDFENDISNLTQEVTKNTTSLNVLENEISLKADSDTVKQILDDELEPIKSSVQSNKAELKVQADLIGSKVDSATYEIDKDGIVKDIETNASAIKQTSNSLTSNIDSVNKRIDEQESIIDTNKSSITQLNNQIALKVDSEYVKQMLDDELNVVKSNVQTNQSELKLLSNQISSKVEKSEYTTDINGITQDIKNTKSEINQLSDSVNSKITSVEQKFDELEIG